MSLHCAAAEERRRDFTGRAEQVRLVMEKATRFAGHPVVITGPPGSGKSALLSEVAARFARSNRGGAVVVRLIGVTSESGDEQALITGLCREVDLRYGRAEAPLPADLQGLGHALQGRLRDVAEGPGLVLVLDGIDQLAGTARPLAWLPAMLPSHVAVVLSTSSPAGSMSSTASELSTRSSCEVSNYLAPNIRAIWHVPAGSGSGASDVGGGVCAGHLAVGGDPDARMVPNNSKERCHLP